MNSKPLLFIFIILTLILCSSSANAAFVPTTYNITAEDTYISEAHPDSNFNGVLFYDAFVSGKHYLSARDTVGGNNVTYMQFTLDDFVTDATLYLYTSGGPGSNWKLWHISNDWDVDTITWNSDRPGTDWTDSPTTPTKSGTSVLPGITSIDVSDIVNLPGTYSFAIKTTTGGNLYIRSAEYGELVPTLNVTTGETYDTIYVNNTHINADDGNNGTVDYPFETISAAVSRASENCTMYIIGNYSEAVTIKGNRNFFNIIGVDNPYLTYTEHALSFQNAYNVSIDGINISTNATASSQYAIDFLSNSGENITIKNCNLSSLMGTVVYFNTGSSAIDVLLENCNIYSDPNYSGYGISFSDGGANTENIRLLNCYVEDIHGGSTYQPGIYLGPGAGSGFEFDYTTIKSGKDGLLLGTNGIAAIDSVFSNIEIFASQDGTKQGSGLNILSGNNNTFKDSDIYYAKYTGIKPNRPTNTTISNITLHSYPPYQAYTHNAVETKGTDMHFYDLRILGHNTTDPYTGGTGSSYHVFYGAGTEQEARILVEDCYSNDTIDRWIAAGGHQENVIFRNMTGENHDGQGIYISSFSMGDDYKTSDKLVFDNTSLENAMGDSADYNVILLSLGSSKNASSYYDYTNISLYGRETVTFIDTNFTGTNNKHWWMVDDGAPAPRMFYGDIYAFNPSHTTTSYTVQEPSRFEGVLHFGYYPKIKVVNLLGQAVDGATVSFVSNATNPETSEIIYAHNIDYGGVEKAYTDTINSSLTLSDGELPDRYENASGAVALTSLMKYYTTSGQTEYVEWNVTATYDGISNSTVITPDMLRYSPDSSDIQSDLVTIVLNVTPFEISSFTPADNTTSSVNGTGQTFTVNLNQNATVVWMKDGVPIETDADVTYAEVTIMGEEAGTYTVQAVVTYSGTDYFQEWEWTVTDASTPAAPTTTPGSDTIDTVGTIMLGAVGLMGTCIIVLAGAFVMRVFDGGSIDPTLFFKMFFGLIFSSFIVLLMFVQIWSMIA